MLHAPACPSRGRSSGSAATHRRTVVRAGFRDRRRRLVHSVAPAETPRWQRTGFAVIPDGTGFPVPDTKASYTNSSASPVSHGSGGSCTATWDAGSDALEHPRERDQSRSQGTAAGTGRPWPRPPVGRLALARLPQGPPRVDGADRADRKHQGSLEAERHPERRCRVPRGRRGRLPQGAAFTDRSSAGKVECGPGEVAPR